MATIGQALTAPENGWKRYNGNDILFTYSGSYTYGANSNYYKSNRTLLNENGMIAFNFTGNK
ncbi:hypothetical protein [Lysinibacillus sp. NPDC093692]|uniref:hypothetical protein n=1 Tax=Lysinibacillus sp. NPDC093692 TaxID=3390578 RepID=UPI003D04F988